MADHERRAQARVRSAGVLIVEQGGRGGNTDYTGCLAGALAARGIPVTIATAGDHLYGVLTGVRIAPVFAYIRGDSRAGRMIRRAGLGRIANGLRFLWSIPGLVALARRHAVVHVQGWERASLGLLATVAMRAAGARIVYTSHNSFERRRWSLDGARVFPRLARATIVHTEADRRVMSGRVTVIPVGQFGAVADTAAATDPAAARAALGLADDVPVVLLFGVLRPDKGLNDLLDAALDASDWLVLVAGEDDGALEAAASRLASPRLAGRVTVVEGFAPIDEVGRFFAAADLVAVPYRRASQSAVLLLAYGFARPVAAYPVGGLTEAVLPGVTGWICSEPSPQALAAVLREAAASGRSELRRLGAAARQWADRQFDWNTIAAATEAVYVDTIGG
ncbi:MAG: glycosyltransferase family 4 protein [Solirubrobacteraceae bacterium]